MSELDDSRPESLSHLEDMVEKSCSPALYLMTEAMDVRDDNAAYAASHFGVCMGLTRALQLVKPYSGRVSLLYPQEVITKHGLRLSDMSELSEEQLKSLTDTTHDIASQAYAHLEKGL